MHSIDNNNAPISINTDDKFNISLEQQHQGLNDLDTIHRFLFDKKPVQGLILKINQALTESLRHQPKYPIAVQKLLGELALIALILRQNIKSDGTLSLAVRSKDSKLTTLLVSVGDGTIRCVASLNDNAGVIADNAKLEDLINPEANLILSTYSPVTKPYQSIIRVNLNSIQQSFIDFYNQSVQLPIFLKLTSTVNDKGEVIASAFFMQYIADGSGTKEDFEDLVVLANTLTDIELLQLTASDILYRLYNQEELKMEFVKFLRFECSCSRQKMLDSLSVLDKSELASILAESSKDTFEVTCQCCGISYEFTQDQVDSNMEHATASGIVIND